jgi:branched-subunit amino acid aminotransferase/4-amino-4-deoxychorismate lyase
MFHLYAVTTTGAQRVTPPAKYGDVAAALHGAGPAVYTGLRTWDGVRFAALDRHLSRLASNAEGAGFGGVLRPDAVRAALDQACRAWPGADARVRIEVRERPLPHLETDARVLLALWPFAEVDARLLAIGVSVSTHPSARRVDPGRKHSEWVQRRLGLHQDPDPHADTDEAPYEQVLMDGEGGMLEGFTSNLHFLSDGVLHSAGARVLPGITRGLALEVMSAMGVPIVEAAFPLSRLDHVTEACLSSSMRGLVPVVRVNGRVIGDGRPGPLTAAARVRLADRMRREACPAV